ncbi:MAG: DUF6465 family protein [Lachnospiraceae bacterium]
MKKTKGTTVTAETVKPQQMSIKLDTVAVTEAKTAAPAKATVTPIATPVKEAEKKAEPVKKAEAEKPAAKKAEPKAAKKPVVKEEVKPEIYVQYSNQESKLNDLIEQAKQAFVAEGHRVSSIKALRLYVKPEENAAYYVINDKMTGELELF